MRAFANVHILQNMHICFYHLLSGVLKENISRELIPTMLGKKFVDKNVLFFP
jgi:hypothetical protein